MDMQGCVVCGQVFEDTVDLIEVAGIGLVCEDCLNDLIDNGFIGTCKDCDEYIVLKQFTLGNGEIVCPTGHYIGGEDKWVCESCLDKYEQCADCGQWFYKDDLTYIDSENKCVCESCLYEYEQCADCRKWFNKEDLTYIDGEDKWVCEDCLDEYRFCEDCETWHNADDMYYIEDCNKCVCEDCFDQNYFRCEDCGEYFSNDQQVITANGDSICEHCYSENYFTCETCGEVYHIIDGVETANGLMCPSCAQEQSEQGLREYHSGKGDNDDYNMPHLVSENGVLLSPEIELDTTNYINPKTGIELEMDKGGHSDTNARKLLDTIGKRYAIASTDGSLESGLEIVSCPSDYYNHIHTLNWKGMLEQARKLRYRSHDTNTCGLHMHVDRAYFRVKDFTNSQVEEKVAVTFANNIDWLKPFSRRKKWDYCQINEDMTVKETAYDVIKNGMKSKNRKPTSHYYAINYANDYTIEFRLFKGTLNYNTLVATMQFVTMFARLIRYRSVAGCANINLNTFKKMAKLCKFDEFLSYLCERKIA